MRMRRKTNLTPRIERCGHLLIPQPEEYRGKWLETFGYDALELEVGCGKGRFIVDTAKSAAYTLFIALEKSANVLVTALEYAALENIQNIRYINAVAENLQDYFAPGEVSRIHIYFCDPWPSNRHIKRRLVGGSFLRLYGVILRQGGEIRFKTDNLPLYEFALKEIRKCGLLSIESSDTPDINAASAILTEYEQRFLEQGLPIYTCLAKKD